MSSSGLPSTLWGVIGSCLRPFKVQAALYVLLSIMVGWWGPISSMLVKELIDSLVRAPMSQGGGYSTVILITGGLVVNFIVLDVLAWRGIGEIRRRYVPIILNRLDQSLLHYVLGHSHHYFNQHMSGSLSKNIFHLLNGIEKIITSSACHLTRALSVVLVSSYCAWQVSPWICVIMLVWFAVFFSNHLIMSQKLILLSDQQAACESLLGGQITDSLSQSAAVRLFAQRHWELEQRLPSLGSYVKAYQKKELYGLRLNLIQGGLIATMIGLSLMTLLFLFSQQRVSVGDFPLILGLTMEIGHILWHTMAEVHDFNKERGRCGQSLRLLLRPQDIQDQPHAKALQHVKGSITFRHVTFRYQPDTSQTNQEDSTEVSDNPPTREAHPESSETKNHHEHNTLASEHGRVFQDLSLHILPGQKVGIVGYSGGGKTTFVNLILRLYDVQEGAILIDDQDIRTVTQDSLRRAIGMIPQDPTLFHRTLMDNIRYGRIDATDDEVMEAAKKALAHDFIMSLPQGYHSLVGDRGIKLSGGQRQRIAIARAILKNAPILILDEATSQLDSVTENAIQESLLRLFDATPAPELSHNLETNKESQEALGTKTVLVIAHRLSTLLQMDRILVFDKGKIVQDGTHKELLATDGMYGTLWSAQVGGFLGKNSTGAP